MNTRRFILPLFWFNLRLLPAVIWYLFFILVAQSIMFAGIGLWFRDTLGDSSSLDGSLNALPLFFCGLIGLQFMAGIGTVTGISLVMPTGEFLLARAIPRSTAYFTRTTIIFLAMLAFPLLNLGFALSKPDLRLTLYHSKTQTTVAYDRLAQLQAQFPDSHVFPTAKATTDILFIPHGQVLIAAWQLWIVFFMAMAIQVVALLASSLKKPNPILIAVCLVPLLIMLFISFGKDSSILMEHAFFLFAHHWTAFLLLALALFTFLQRFALQRIRDLEVI